MKREVHEWHEREDDTTRFWRANLTWQGWVFRTTRKKDPEWERLETPSRELWEKLRDILFRKYQRARVPWRLVEDIDKTLESMPVEVVEELVAEEEEPLVEEG